MYVINCIDAFPLIIGNTMTLILKYLQNFKVYIIYKVMSKTMNNHLIVDNIKRHNETITTNQIFYNFKVNCLSQF